MGSLQEFKIKVNSNKILKKSSIEQLHYAMNELLALGGLSQEQENKKESLCNELSRIPNEEKGAFWATISSLSDSEVKEYLRRLQNL